MPEAKEHIVIRGCGAISPQGHDAATTAQAYLSGRPAFSNRLHQQVQTPIAQIAAEAEVQLQQLITANPMYRQLDRSVLLAVYAAKQAVAQAGWVGSQNNLQEGMAVNIGSSRGATGLFEHHYDSYQQGHLSPSASPTTTLGNLSSWVAHAVNAGGAQISHSITCSTALMAVANGVAWLKSGMADRFLAGGAEAPLTDFTLAQMKAVGIYSRLQDTAYPCQPYGTSGQNTFVLGEGAAVLALEKASEEDLKPGDIIMEAIGYGFEQIESKTGISAEGINFQKSMRHALAQLGKNDCSIDAIITHTPGTLAGDRAELAAIRTVFPDQTPFITTNKWLLGHTLGASGALSLQYAIHILRHQQIPLPPYPISLSTPPAAHLRRIMVNAAGFGGNAASLIISVA